MIKMDNIKNNFKNKPMEKKYYSLEGMIWRFLLLSFVPFIIGPVVISIILFLKYQTLLIIYNLFIYDIPWVFLSHIFLLTFSDGKLTSILFKFITSEIDYNNLIEQSVISFIALSFILSRINFFFIFIFFNNYIVRRILFSLYSFGMFFLGLMIITEIEFNSYVLFRRGSSNIRINDKYLTELVPFSIEAFTNYIPHTIMSVVVSYIIVLFLPRSLFNFHWKVTEEPGFIKKRKWYIFGILLATAFIISLMILLKAILFDLF